MNDKEKLIAEWMESQNNEFLQRVKCSYIFLHDDQQTRKLFAIISQDGTHLQIINGITLEFHNTFAPNHGIYKGSYSLSPFSKDSPNSQPYIPASLAEYIYHPELHPQISINHNMSSVYIEISFRQGKTWLSIANQIHHTNEFDTPILLIPIIF